jgi:hypothetical protein
MPTATWICWSPRPASRRQPDSPAYQPHLLLNDGRGRFAPAPAGMLPPLPISVGAVAAADFEHSGRLGLFSSAAASCRAATRKRRAAPCSRGATGAMSM